MGSVCDFFPNLPPLSLVVRETWADTGSGKLNPSEEAHTNNVQCNPGNSFGEVKRSQKKITGNNKRAKNKYEAVWP